MSGRIIFITTNQIQEGALEKVKDATKRSTEFFKANGPQLMAEVFIDESKLRFIGIQVHRDSESILTHWQISDPYMQDVMQYITTTHVDIFGQPNEAVMEGMKGFSSQGTIISVIPRFAGFSRFPGME